ncbi:hypothetical protein [Fig virus B]|uniref:p5 n=1 Tax=Fig closterovirus 1 TaxID=2809010 RepID=A0A8A0XUR4_9CLOS|nr:hypothetical protein [Fig virus B]QSQ86322.1 p5 [Fig closterovirus 1]
MTSNENSLSAPRSFRAHMFIAFKPSLGRFKLSIFSPNAVVVLGDSHVTIANLQNCTVIESISDRIDTYCVVHVEYCVAVDLYQHSFDFNTSGFVCLSLSLEDL